MLERMLKKREIAKLEGKSTRWLDQMIADDKFPRPDLPAQRRGESHRWCESTVERWREERAAAAAAAPKDVGGRGRLKQGAAV